MDSCQQEQAGHFVVEQPAVADKRLYVAESEFGRVLVVMDREGNSLSECLREAWETGDLRTMTRNKPLTATGAHITICGQITRDELFLRLKDVDIYNGLSNRFLWFCVRRSKLKPDGGETDIRLITEHLDTLKERIEWAKTCRRTPSQRRKPKRSGTNYTTRLNKEIAGPYGAVTCRAEAQVLRLSMIFALADKSVEITLAAPEGGPGCLAVRLRFCSAPIRD